MGKNQTSESIPSVRAPGRGENMGTVVLDQARVTVLGTWPVVFPWDGWEAWKWGGDSIKKHLISMTNRESAKRKLRFSDSG